MATLLSPARSTGLTQHAFGRVCAPQRRWARVHDVRFLATHQSKERIIDRYREKLDQKAKQEGLNDIGQLKEVYKEKITELKKKATVPGANAPLHGDTSSASTSPASASSASSTSPWPRPPPPPAHPLDQLSPSSPNYKPPGLKTLDSFINVKKTMDLPQKEIESIWRLRHAHHPQSLCASIPIDTWNSIYRTARRHPQFILPGLPRKEAEVPEESTDTEKKVIADGAPIHFLQWTFPAPDTATVMFTHLAEYKLRGEYAQPHTTLTHHSELAAPKGIVLCQGSVIDGRGVSIEEGKWLVMNMQKFYNIGEDVEQQESSGTGKELKMRRRRLVEMFTEGHQDFRVEDLMEEAERMG